MSTLEEPLSKRPRLDDTEQQAAQQQQQQQLQPQQHDQAGPTIQALFQIPAGLKREPSPGAMHGCRIAAWALQDAPESAVYCSAIATGPRVYWSQVSALRQQVKPEQGKEGILLPVRLTAQPVLHLEQLSHAGEVQALALHQCARQQQAAEQGQQAQQLLLASVDSYGSGSVTRLQLQVQQQGSESAAVVEDEQAGRLVATPAGTPAVLAQLRLRPQDACREGGWAGACFSSSSSASDAGLLLAAARGFARDVSLYDVESGGVVRTYHTALNPYALKFLPPDLAGSDGQLLAVAESHVVSLWDARAAGAAGGCVQRLATATVGQPLYALDWCAAQGGLLGSAGAERSVFITEPRKWKLLSKWGGATRLAIHSLSFLQADPRYAVLAGLDLEVLCGRWDKPGSSARAFQSTAAADDGEPAAAAAAAAAKPTIPAAPGAPGSGDRTRAPAAAAAAVTGDGVGSSGGDGGSANPTAAASAGFSFRGDARWLGVSKAAGVDVLAGFAASGNLVYARVR
ncbi:hypothetical protein COO60DRAFT_411654 [Scenedesmus sp. NREL 46B-D3]|nr:hypothetical protein COO60DRAFT_411654 [Scenedesmus sp. NREL 46B-D3]